MLWLACCLLAGDETSGKLRHAVPFEGGPEIRFTASEARKYGWSVSGVHVDFAKESYETIVPSAYRPDGGWGVLVYIAPGPRGSMVAPKLNEAKLAELLTKHKLIFAGANGGGNDRNVAERMQLALGVLHAVQSKYKTAPARNVCAGMSGGAKMACFAGRIYPDLFPAVVAMAGSGYHRPAPAGPGRQYPPDMNLTAAQDKAARQRIALAFVTGPKDFNYEPMVRFDEAYKKAGWRTLLVDVPDLGHEIPDEAALDRALTFVLDAEGRPAPAKPPRRKN